DLAERIKALRGVNTVDATPERAPTRQVSAEVPVTSRILHLEGGEWQRRVAGRWDGEAARGDWPIGRALEAQEPIRCFSTPDPGYRAPSPHNGPPRPSPGVAHDGYWSRRDERRLCKSRAPGGRNAGKWPKNPVMQSVEQAG